MVLRTKYDYHYDLPDRGPSGDMTGGEFWRYTSTGLFNSCNPTPTGEVGLGFSSNQIKFIMTEMETEEMNIVLCMEVNFVTKLFAACFTITI